MATGLQERRWGERVTPYVSLDRQPEGSRVMVMGLHCGPTPTLRLAEMGVLVGAVLRVQRSAPLGGPLLIEVQGSLVALGRRLAHSVLTRTLP